MPTYRIQAPNVAPGATRDHDLRTSSPGAANQWIEELAEALGGKVFGYDAMRVARQRGVARRLGGRLVVTVVDHP